VQLSWGRRLFLRTLVVSLCLTAAIAIGTLLFGEFDDEAWRIVLTTTFLALASLLALPAGVLLDHGRGRLLAQAVLLLTGAGLGVALLALWADPEADWVWKLALTFGLAALVGAAAATTTWPRSPGDTPLLTWLYWTAVLLSSALVAMILAGVWRGSDADDSIRFMGALAIGAVLATLIQPIVRRLQQQQPAGGELVLRVDRAPSDEAVAAAVEALAHHGIRADVVGLPRV
jgi:hypothetical protein